MDNNTDNNIEVKLDNFLKYCLGYIKLINPAFSRSKVSTDPLEKDIFDHNFIHTVDPDTSSILLDLDAFYSHTPKELTDDNRDEYLRQKTIATKLDEIRNKFKVDEYTKQINLNFGFFKVEIPENSELLELEKEETPKKTTAKDGIYPLFSVPVDITIRGNKYYIELLDSNVIPNFGFLQDVLGENRYFEFADFIRELEIDGELSLPISKETISRIWDFLSLKLKLSKAEFDENSFDFYRFVVSLASKSNYFLAQDLAELSKAEEEDLLDTALSSWVSEEDLNIQETVNERDGELFFPFDYNKHQLKVLSVINNKASIVQGPPGTGKSQTIANIICHLAANGKRVLFLSQKAQALKVVKDKLKDLDTPYLYGYIPNRHSPIYSQEEENDSASNALMGISQYISSFEDNRKEKLDDKVYSLEKTKDFFNLSITKQREIFSVYQTISDLEEYETKPLDEDRVLESLNKESYQEIVNFKKEIESLTSYCGEYVAKSGPSNSYNTKFKNLTEKTYSETISSICKEIDRVWYDRKSFIGGILNNPILKLRLRNITNKLPCEIFEEFNSIIGKKRLKSEILLELNNLGEYFKYKECAAKLIEVNEAVGISLNQIGLDNEGFAKLLSLVEKYGFDDAIVKIQEKIRAEKQLRQIKFENPNEVALLMKQVKLEYKDRVKTYLRNRIKKQIRYATSSAAVKGIIHRIAKALTKSKKAHKTFDKLKSDDHNFEVLKDIVPIWIMDLEDVSRLVPLKKGLFDYIILDEASQCNIAYAMPAMYRSKHVILFGDSEQMRDTTIRFKTNNSLIKLARDYSIPDHLQIKSEEDSVKSIIDIGNNRGFPSQNLLYHYRSPKELIGFSNDQFYAPIGKKLEVINSSYLPYKDTNKVMVNHFIEPEHSEQDSDKTNISEAKHILNLIKDLRADEKTKDKSIGVVTFLNEQAWLLQEMIEDESIKVSTVENIQGDEKDIIIYSFVISSPDQKRRYISLTGEGGDIASSINRGRVNVAFSRARMQVHCVSSLSIEEWPAGIWIDKYLNYVEKNGEVNYYDQNLKSFDSFFEEEFYYLIRNHFDKNYIIQNQVESCGFKIDFVVTDIKANKKLAIECDGPTHFEKECTSVYVDSDLERQLVLESAGWKFYRIPYSDWISDSFDRNSVSKEIEEFFSECGAKRKDLLEIADLVIDNPIITSDKEEVIAVSSEKIDDELNEKKIKPISTKKYIHSEYLLIYCADETRDILVSLVDSNRCLWITERIKSGNQSEVSKNGIGIAILDLQNFLDKTANTLSTGNENSISWKGEGKSKLIFKRIGQGSISIQHYVESQNFTGFTKRGFSLTFEQYIQFVALLVEKINAISE